MKSDLGVSNDINPRHTEPGAKAVAYPLADVGTADPGEAERGAYNVAAAEPADIASFIHRSKDIGDGRFNAHAKRIGRPGKRFACYGPVGPGQHDVRLGSAAIHAKKKLAGVGRSAFSTGPQWSGVWATLCEPGAR